MNMSPGDRSAGDAGERFRRTALVLHALVPADRDWVLAQLSATEGAELRGLLRELAELGLPGDRDLVAGVLAKAAEVSSKVPAEYKRLEVADAAGVHECLATQPDRLIATVLAARDWPWTGELLSRLGPVRAERIREQSCNWQPPARLQEAVISTLACKVQECACRPSSLQQEIEESAPRRRWWRRSSRRPAA